MARGEGSGYGVCAERAAVSVSEGRVEGEGLGRVVFSIGRVSFNGLRANVELDFGGQIEELQGLRYMSSETAW